jgi:hypothetical protein
MLPYLLRKILQHTSFQSSNSPMPLSHSVADFTIPTETYDLPFLINITGYTGWIIQQVLKCSRAELEVLQGLSEHALSSENLLGKSFSEVDNSGKRRDSCMKSLQQQEPLFRELFSGSRYLGDLPQPWDKHIKCIKGKLFDRVNKKAREMHLHRIPEASLGRRGSPSSDAARHTSSALWELETSTPSRPSEDVRRRQTRKIVMDEDDLPVGKRQKTAAPLSQVEEQGTTVDASTQTAEAQPQLPAATTEPPRAESATHEPSVPPIPAEAPPSTTQLMQMLQQEQKLSQQRQDLLMCLYRQLRPAGSEGGDDLV